MTKVEEFDRRVGKHRDQGKTVLVASVKACRELAKERKQGKGGKR